MKKVEVSDWTWLGRSLSNYKSMHESLAKQKGVLRDFMEASTLTRAKKILFGYKRKNTK